MRAAAATTIIFPIAATPAGLNTPLPHRTVRTASGKPTRRSDQPPSADSARSGLPSVSNQARTGRLPRASTAIALMLSERCRFSGVMRRTLTVRKPNHDVPRSPAEITLRICRQRPLSSGPRSRYQPTVLDQWKLRIVAVAAGRVCSLRRHARPARRQS